MNSMSERQRGQARVRSFLGIGLALPVLAGLALTNSAEVLGAGGWSIVSSPNVSGAENLLYGTSCVSATNCWTVGWSNAVPNTTQALAEQWSGSNWSIATTPSIGTSNLVQSVSC